MRVTNGVPEIIVKLGRWGEKDCRREISVKTAPGSFDDLVEIFGILGLKKGVLCIRNSKVYDYKDTEFALVEVPNHSYFYEAEKMIDKSESEEDATRKILDVCNELKLKTFSKKDFFQYLDVLNKEVNELFDFDYYKKNYFKERFSL